MPTFSEITIEFLRDWEEDFTLSLTYKNGSTVTAELFTWVATRSAGFEVTTGTPTATAGERTAINFESAFDLDNPAGYITTQTSNSITIQSETLGEDFIGVRGLDNTGLGLRAGIDFNITFSNYVVPPDTSNIELALVRSPHYINIPFDFPTTTSATVELYIWNGDLGTIPTTATYTLTIPRPSTDFAEFNINISQFIHDEIESSLTVNVSSTSQIVNSTDNSVKWIYYSASYTDPSEVIADITGTLAGVDGYGLYNEGINPTKPNNEILTSSTMRKVSRDGIIVFPFVNNGDITSIDVDSDGGEINETETITTSADSTEFIQYVQVNVSDSLTDDYITFTTLPDNNTVTYEVIDECRYNPILVLFKNRYGVFDQITLFKKNAESLNTDKDSFINNYVSGGTYDITKHQFQKLNVTNLHKRFQHLVDGQVDPHKRGTLFEDLFYDLLTLSFGSEVIQGRHLSLTVTGIILI